MNNAAYMAPERAAAALEAVGTRICSVTFVKNDGTERTVTGLLKATSRLVGSERGAAHSAAMRDAGRVWIGVANPPSPDKASASFYLHRVKRIRFNGMEFSA